MDICCQSCKIMCKQVKKDPEWIGVGENVQETLI